MTRRFADRRGQSRFEVVGELWGTLDTLVGMPVRNISRGGALVECVVPLDIDSVHDVRVSCDGHHSTAMVRVRHVRVLAGHGGAEQYLVGLEFVQVAPELLAQIDVYVKHDVASGRAEGEPV